MFLKLFLLFIICFIEPIRVYAQFGSGGISDGYGPVQGSGGYGPQGVDGSVGFDAPVNPYPPEAPVLPAGNDADVGPSAEQTPTDPNPSIGSQTQYNATDLLHQPDVGDATCLNPNVERMTVPEMCSLPPEKGFGTEDILRIYYNPVVGQCLPFSYMGFGGNYNRFISIKNCYEICNPAQASVKKPRVVAGIKAYLVPKPKNTCPEQDTENNVYGSYPMTGDVQIITAPPAGSVVIWDGSGTTKVVPTQQPKVKIIQRMFYNDYYYPQQSYLTLDQNFNNIPYYRK